MICLAICRGQCMKRFVEGADRGQSTLLPECLDEWVEESNSVRVVDCFVDGLSASKASSLQRQAGLRTTPRFF